jgi:DNA mismatch endonuclease (patch repair protein)
MGGKLGPAERRALMARFRSTDTRPELALRRALRSAGLRGYRTHLRGVAGKPDIAYTRWKVAVFVDGAFWHGHPSVFQVGAKGEYWDWKIGRNRERDRSVDATLRGQGWSVVRVWDIDLAADEQRAVQTIAAALHARGRKLEPARR